MSYLLAAVKKVRAVLGDYSCPQCKKPVRGGSSPFAYSGLKEGNTINYWCTNPKCNWTSEITLTAQELAEA